MTEKRFMIDDAGELIDLSNHTFIDYGDEVCDLLNQLNEENERLQHFESVYREQNMRLIKENNELGNENEQLKIENKRLKDNIDELLSVNVEEDLLKENNELKERIDEYTDLCADISEIREKNDELKDLCKTLIKHIKDESIAFVISDEVRRLIE